MTARLALVLVPGTELAPGLLPDAPRVRLELVHHGHPTEAAILALLGQDPLEAWSGPAAFAAAAAGRLLGPRETAWLLEPVHASSDGRVVLEGPLGPAPAGVLARVAAALGVGRVEVLPGEPATLVVREPLSGPSTAVAELLEGRGLDTFLDGPPVLREVLTASRAACRDAGGPATHLVPHSPAGPLQVRPLAQAWPHVRSAAVVGSGPAARALALLLGAAAVAAPPGEELRAARAELPRRDVVVVLPAAAPPGRADDLSPLEDAPVLVLASEPDAEGTLDVAVRGAPPPTETRDPLARYVEPR